MIRRRDSCWAVVISACSYCAAADDRRGHGFQTYGQIRWHVPTGLFGREPHHLA